MLRPGAFQIPPAPLVLTLAGLLPFLGGAGAVIRLSDDIARQAAAGLILIAYAAVILSFLGGVRWGVEMASNATRPRWSVLAGSVVGALAGWGLVLQPVLGGGTGTPFVPMAGLLALHWAWDLSARATLPPWYDGLRTVATAGAVVALLAAGTAM